MKYELRITCAAENDLSEAADYLEFSLMNPQAADDLLDAAEATLRSLSEHPQRHAPAADPVLKAWGVRLIPVGSYLAFYVISEDEHRVYVIRFLYGKRNWRSILRGGFSMDAEQK